MLGSVALKILLKKIKHILSKTSHTGLCTSRLFKAPRRRTFLKRALTTRFYPTEQFVSILFNGCLWLASVSIQKRVESERLNIAVCTALRGSCNDDKYVQIFCNAIYLFHHKRITKHLLIFLFAPKSYSIFHKTFFLILYSEL